MSKKAKRSKIKIKTYCKYCGRPTENLYYEEYCCTRCESIDIAYDSLIEKGVPFIDGVPYLDGKPMTFWDCD